MQTQNTKGKSTDVKRCEEIADLLNDVGSILVSPFFLASVTRSSVTRSKEKAEEYFKIGYYAMLFSQVFRKLTKEVRKKGIRSFKFAIHSVSNNGCFYPIRKEDVVKLVSICEKLHRRGIRNILTYTPSSTEYIEKTYIETCNRKPLFSGSVHAEIPGIDSKGVDFKYYVFSSNAKEQRALHVNRLFDEEASAEARGRLSSGRIRELLRNYDPDKAEVIDVRGNMRVTMINDVRYVEYRVRIRETSGGYERLDDDPLKIIYSKNTDIVRTVISDALLNVRLSGYDVYPWYTVIVKRSKDATEYIVAFLTKK